MPCHCDPILHLNPRSGLPLWRLSCIRCGKATAWFVRPELDPVGLVTKMLEDYTAKGEEPPYRKATLDELKVAFNALG